MESRAKAKEKLMNIGSVAKLSGVGVETIRFYERSGVLPQPKRKLSGYRQFDMDTVARIQSIKQLQELGFSLAEAGDLASSKGVPAAMKRTGQQIHDLQQLQRELIKRQKSARIK